MTKKRLFCILAAVLFGISALWVVIDTPILYAIVYADVNLIQPKDGLNWSDWVQMVVFLALAALFIVKANKEQLPDWAFIIPLSLVIIFRFYFLFSSIDNYIQTIETVKNYFSFDEMSRYYIDAVLNVTNGIIGAAAVVFLLLSLLLKKRLGKLFFLPAVLSGLCLFLQNFGYFLDLAMAGTVSLEEMGRVILLISLNSVFFALQAASYLFFGWALIKEEKAEPRIEENGCAENTIEIPALLEEETVDYIEQEPEQADRKEFAIGVTDELKKYKELLDIGAISQEEYEAAKQRLLKM